MYRSWWLIFLRLYELCSRQAKKYQNIVWYIQLEELYYFPHSSQKTYSTLIYVFFFSYNPMKYGGVLNFGYSDFNTFFGREGGTKSFAPLYQPHVIYNKTTSILMIVEHAEISYDVDDDMSWFTGKFLLDTMEEHIPVRCKKMRCESAAYMNSYLRKALYKRNMAHNKYTNYGYKYWEENLWERNNIPLRTKHVSHYFAKKCAKRDKSIWATISPFKAMYKTLRNDGKIMLEENDWINHFKWWLMWNIQWLFH